MKKLTKIIAGLAVAASVLLAASCKNQLDALDDEKSANGVARNAVQIVGVSVTGLDAVYNGAEVNFMYVAPGETAGSAIETAKVADSYKDKAGNTIGYQSGSAYKKIEPFLYDSDALNKEMYEKAEDKSKVSTSSKLECYLQIGNDTIKVRADDGKIENAKLTIPTSPAGTSDADLAEKWIVVTVSNGIGTFAFADKAEEPINVTLACITMDISEYTESKDAVTIKATDKTGTNPKYTLKVIGLDADQAGMKVQLAGATIGGISDNTTMGDYWDGGEADVISAADQEKSSFNQEIKKTEGAETCEVSWQFYGTTPSWEGTKKGPAIKIYKPGCKDSVYFLKTGAGGNFHFPTSTWGTNGDNDVECTIDVSKLKKGADYAKADPVTQPDKFEISAIYIENAPAPSKDRKIYITTPDGFGSDKQKASAWDLPENKWSTECHSYTEADLIEGNLAWIFGEGKNVVVQPNKPIFSLGYRLMDSDPKKGFDWDKDDKTEKGYCTVDYQTSEMKDGVYTLYCNYKTKEVRLVKTSDVNWPKVVATLQFKLVNAKADATYWISGQDVNGWNGWPYNSWCGDTAKEKLLANPQYIVKTDAAKTGVYAFASKVETVYNQPYTCGGFKAVKFDKFDGTSDVYDTQNIENLVIPASKESKTYTITYDITGKSATIAEGSISDKVKIAGVFITGMDKTDYPDGTKCIFGGDQIGWPEAAEWDGTVQVAEVKDGQVMYTLPTPVESTAVNLGILVNPSNWDKRIALKYQEDAGNGSLANSKTGETVYIYANVSGLSQGDNVNWQLVPEDIVPSLK